MRLYAGLSSNFIALNFNHQLADILKAEFRTQFGYNPSMNEVISWQNSLHRVAHMIDRAGLYDNGIFVDQTGCIYTAQGFEFDYVGVIFGTDLRFNLDKSEWEGHPEDSYDESTKNADDFLQLVKNTYRVLLTRGIKGCYVYFMDKDTERFIKSRLKTGKF